MLDPYYQRFKPRINTATIIEAGVDIHDVIIPKETEINPSITQSEVKKISAERYRAMMLLMNSDIVTYTILWDDLQKSHTIGDNKYLTEITTAYDILNKYNKVHTPLVMSIIIIILMKIKYLA